MAQRTGPHDPVSAPPPLNDVDSLDSDPRSVLALLKLCNYLQLDTFADAILETMARNHRSLTADHVSYLVLLNPKFFERPWVRKMVVRVLEGHFRQWESDNELHSMPVVRLAELACAEPHLHGVAETVLTTIYLTTIYEHIHRLEVAEIASLVTRLSNIMESEGFPLTRAAETISRKLKGAPDRKWAEMAKDLQAMPNSFVWKIAFLVADEAEKRAEKTMAARMKAGPPQSGGPVQSGISPIDSDDDWGAVSPRGPLPNFDGDDDDMEDGW
ncbi:unnamed protein product [Vitrella brassicaformis CCMP3155]|uniref:Uncharacterized protein n=2 Tax=Vitrella brassicaformis TaxID=1169539 RepID=A0A0G4FYD0_VITBC|nr:unnamed protein product [Vitrella brassicaformis CCMP3155]|mmetsp:Transcript_33463/g.82884  ORF Transcript_33463/g.82884 Transcript_33463/m.82884 type:complete len:271 (+) Transcript_33463:439-1251(+)|eukprot:CEM20441.1 unnamed protein product [Vitrella brassicaformis CCMP3155]